MKILIVVLILFLSIAAAGAWQLSQSELRPSPSPIARFFSSPSPEITPEPTPLPLQACDLIAKDVVSELVGEVVADPRQSSILVVEGVVQQNCVYLAESGAFTPSVTIGLRYPVAVATLETEDLTFKTAWEAEQASAAAGARYQVVPELGLAYRSQQQLRIWHQNYDVSVIVSLADPRENAAVAEAVAQAIVASWP